MASTRSPPSSCAPRSRRAPAWRCRWRRRAFAGLVERHPALRTTFEERRGELTRRVHAHLPLDWRMEAPPPLAPPPRPPLAELPAIAEAAAWQPFDLQRGPLLRVRLWPL